MAKTVLAQGVVRDERQQTRGEASADTRGWRSSEILCVLRLALALLASQPEVVKGSVALL